MPQLPQPIDAAYIKEVADKMIARYGARAIVIAKEKADKAQIGAFPSEKDIALRVLTALEIMIV